MNKYEVLLRAPNDMTVDYTYHGTTVEYTDSGNIFMIKNDQELVAIFPLFNLITLQVTSLEQKLDQ